MLGGWLCCRQMLVRHEWGVLRAASAAFSLYEYEGNRVPRVAVSSRAKKCSPRGHPPTGPGCVLCSMCS